MRRVRDDRRRRARNVRLGIVDSSVERLEARQRQRRVLRLADEHAVDLRRALHRLRRRRRRVRTEAEHRRAEMALISPIAATSASSVGVVLGNRISVGLKPSRSSCAIRSSTDRRSAVRSTSRISQPASRSSVASSASV